MSGLFYAQFFFFFQMYLLEMEGESNSMSDTEEEAPVNVFQAAMNGAISSVPIVVSIVVTVLCFMSLFSLLNQIVGYLGYLVDIQGIGFESVFGVILFPCE